VERAATVKIHSTGPLVCCLRSVAEPTTDVVVEILDQQRGVNSHYGHDIPPCLLYTKYPPKNICFKERYTITQVFYFWRRMRDLASAQIFFQKFGLATGSRFCSSTNSQNIAPPFKSQHDASSCIVSSCKNKIPKNNYFIFGGV